ncbi:hypothetical protein CYG49_01570 [Candidatus Saccharibacteria bacterium]|nr:MAG: hypothetical protein CYG49_01570 [Candidatus Saccharibacteria bacterium]
MDIPRQRSESLEISHPAVRLCGLYFELAMWQTLEEPEKHFILMHGNAETGGQLEYIALMKEEETIHLFRRSAESESTTAFPFFLRQMVTAFDAQSGEPCQFPETFHIDTYGRFHQELQQGSSVLLKPVDDHTNLRLSQFLDECNLADMIILQPQE